MPAVFSDIVGTCFTYDEPIAAMTERFGPQLQKHGLQPQLFFHAVQLATERDEVYMNLANQKRVTLPQRWMENFPKVLYQSGLTPAQVEEIFDEEGVKFVTDTWLHSMKPREGFAEALEVLKKGGVEFYAASGASPERVKNYFKKAGIEIADDHVVDFLSVGVSKPASAPYEFIFDKFGKGDAKQDVIIFQASHNWDLAGAKRSGFQTAYVTAYEHYPCPNLWGEPDVTADDLVTLAKKIVEKWGTK